MGVAAFFAGYDQNVFGFAIPQIQASLHIAENQVGPTVSYFRIATLVALLISASADLVGRRRLLLITLFGQACFTLLSAFAPGYVTFVWAQFLTRVFGYAEEMLCFVVIAEEVSPGARGWANGTLSALDYLGAGIASLLFAAVDILPYGWAFAVCDRFRLPVPDGMAAAQPAGNPAFRRPATGPAIFVANGGKRGTTQGTGARISRAASSSLRLPRRRWGSASDRPVCVSSKYLQSVYHYKAWQTTRCDHSRRLCRAGPRHPGGKIV